jgi:hypothetical protein
MAGMAGRDHLYLPLADTQYPRESGKTTGKH